MKLALTTLLLLTLATPPALGQTAEVRGTWMTTTANDALASPEKTAESMRRLREIGLNVVYVECWKNGYTEFPSDTMDALIGVPLKLNNTPAELQRDLLQESVIEAHRNGLLAVAWFEYGFMAAHKDTHNELRKLADERGWLTKTKDGEVVGKQNPFVWMNPLHPGPQQLLLDIVLEAIDKYDLDGVQLDDRIAMPVEMGYDDYTKQLYASEHGGAMPPEDPRDPQWGQWRADKVSEYARRFASEIKAKRPDVIVSVSPAPYPWSLENYACDWPRWMTWRTDAGRPLWDESLPQCYRMDAAATIKSIDEQIEAVSAQGHGRLASLVAGVRLVGEGPDLPAEGLAQIAAHTRAAGIGGQCLWFSRGVLEVMPEAVSKVYERPAVHPSRPADWRSKPIVATKAGGWTADVAEAGRYRVIARVDGQWQVADARPFDAGRVAVEAPADAEAVELLVDRRPSGE